jgi:hypothetical protein
MSFFVFEGWDPEVQRSSYDELRISTVGLGSSMEFLKRASSSLLLIAVIHNKEHKFFWPHWVFVFKQLIADVYGVSNNACALRYCCFREYGARKRELMNIERKKEQERNENGKRRDRDKGR